MNTTLTPYPEYRDSGQDWPEKIPSHWKVRRLKTATPNIVNGLWGDDPTGSEDIACVRVADFDRFQLQVNFEEPTMRSVELSRRTGRILKKGDLLLEKSGGGDLQPVGVVVSYDHNEPAICSNFIAKLEVSDGCVARFLTYLHAVLYEYRMNVRSIKQTTGIQNLDTSAYLGEKAAFPPTGEQRRIARFLDTVTDRTDRLIRAKERLIELLEEQKQAIIQQAVTHGLDPDVEMKDSGVDWLGDLPAHWNLSRIKNEFWNLDHKRIPLSSTERGKMESQKYDYYGASGIIDQVDDYLFDDDLILIAEDGANLVARNLPLVIIAKGRFWVNNHAHILKPKQGSLEYWAHLLESLSYKPWIKGAAQPKLSQDRLMSVPVPKPPASEQDEIVSHIRERTEPLQKVIHRTQSETTLIREYRTRLIADVVTGKLDVREAEATRVEDGIPMDLDDQQVAATA